MQRVLSYKHKEVGDMMQRVLSYKHKEVGTITTLKNNPTNLLRLVIGFRVSGDGNIPASNADSPILRREGCFPK